MSDKLDHPCKQTCSGWKQGFERGFGDKLKVIRTLGVVSGALQAIEISPDDFNMEGLKKTLDEVNELLHELGNKE